MREFLNFSDKIFKFKKDYTAYIFAFGTDLFWSILVESELAKKLALF
jgi:hypothetical protein